MTLFLILIAVAHQRDVALRSQSLDQTERELLSMVLDAPTACVDRPVHQDFESVLAGEYRPAQLPGLTSAKEPSLGPRDGIQTSYRLTGIPRPRIVARILRPSALRREIVLHTDSSSAIRPPRDEGAILLRNVALWHALIVVYRCSDPIPRSPLRPGASGLTAQRYHEAMMPRLLAVLALAATVVAQQPQTPAPAAPPQGPLAAGDVAALLKQFNVPGVSIAVVNDFGIEWARGYGVADVESGAPVTADTMFQAASISKTVAAMTSMKAVQDGRFTLDQDVNTILKSWKLPGDGHTSAAARDPAQPDEPHVGHRRRLRLSRLRARRAAADHRPDPRRPAAVESAAGAARASAAHRLQVLGRRRDDPGARAVRQRRPAVRRASRASGCSIRSG